MSDVWQLFQSLSCKMKILKSFQAESSGFQADSKQIMIYLTPQGYIMI